MSKSTTTTAPKTTTKKLTRKEIVLSDGTQVFLRKPGLSQVQKADWAYSRTFNEAIREQIPPRATLLKQLRTDGIWTEDDIALETELRKRLAEGIATLAIMSSSPDKAAFDEARENVAACRESLYAHTSRLTAYLQHCAENRAEDARNYTLAFLCAEDEEGNRIWNSQSEYEEDGRDELVQRCAIAIMYLVNGLDPDDVTRNFPENMVSWSPVTDENTNLPAEVQAVVKDENTGN